MWGYEQNDAQVTATGSITSVSNVARIVAKDQLAIEAGRDVVDTAGRIGSGGTAFISGGRDVKFESLATGSSYQANVGASSMTREATQANVGQIDAGGNLDLHAGRDLKLDGTQASAGGNADLSAGRHLTLDAATSSQSSDQRSDPAGTQYRQTRSETTVQGASVKAGGNLSAKAGTTEKGNLSVTGSALASQGLTTLHASGNVVIDTARETSSRDDYTNVSKSGLLSKKTTVEHEIRNSDTAVRSSITGNLTAITAGQDIDIEGARIAGDEGVLVMAGRNLSVREARDTRDSSYAYSTSKSGLGLANGLIVPEKNAASDATTHQSNSAVATIIESASGGVLLQSAGKTLVQGARIDASKDLTITGATVAITGATDYEASGSEQYRKNSNLNSILTRSAGGINAKRTDTQDTQATRLVETTLQGANINLTATGADGQDGTLLLAGTTIDTPGKLTLEADKLVMGVQTTQTDTSRTSQGRDLMWQKAQGEGTTDQTTNYVKINAGQLVTNVQGVQADLGARDSIEALGQQPGMGWVNQLQNDPKLSGKVDWVKVEEAHTKWDYKQQGLTPEGAAIVTLVAAFLTAGAASGAGAAVGNAAAVTAGEGVAMAGGGAFLTGTGATISGVVGGAVAAGVTALASQAAVAVIDNRGNLNDTLHDLGSSASVKGLATAIVTGGVLGGLNLNPTGQPTVGGGAQGFMTQLGQNLQAGAAKALIGTAINGGSLEESLKNNLKTAFIDTAAAQGAFAIGSNLEPGSAANLLAHAIAGCAAGAARTDGGCGAGALGAAMGELAASLYDPAASNSQADTVQFASMMGGIAVAVAGGDATEINVASQAAGNAAANNWLAAQQRAQMKKEMDAAKTAVEKLQVFGKWTLVSGKQDVLTATGVGKGLAEAGISDVQGLAEFLAHPIEGLNGLKQIISSPEARQQLGDAMFAELDAKIARMQTALNVGGGQNAEQLGTDLGGIIWQVGSVVAGTGGVVKAGSTLAGVAVASVGVRVEAATFGKILNNFYRDGAPPDLIQKLFNQAATSSTHNAMASEVVLGRYIAGSVDSYEAVAQSRGATYFSMSDWGAVQGQLGADQMWNINKAFLDQQMAQGKAFVFTADPALARVSSFTSQEYQYLLSKSYSIFENKGLYYAVKK